MSRHRHQLRLETLLVFLLAPLLLVSVGYALFSQNLSLQGTSRAIVNDPAEPNLVVSSTRTVWQTGVNFNYTMSVTVSNIGTLASTGWEIIITLPATISGLSCWNVLCSLSGTTLTMTNMSYNGSIAPGASTDFGMSFKSKNSAINFDTYDIEGDSGLESDDQYIVISGLNASFTPSGSWNSGGNHIKQYNVQVTNTTGARIKAWKIFLNWNSTSNSVVAIWNATYVAEPTVLKLSNGGQLDSGSTASFGMQLGVPTSSWNPTFIIKGRQ